MLFSISFVHSLLSWFSSIYSSLSLLQKNMGFSLPLYIVTGYWLFTWRLLISVCYFDNLLHYCILVWIFKFIFNWMIIAWQYCVGFCHISTWISHRHTCILSLLSLPSTSHPIFTSSQHTGFDLPASYSRTLQFYF